MQEAMVLKKIAGHVHHHTKRAHHHAKMAHHRITNHPHYELVVGHAIEGVLVVAGFFAAVSFGSTGSLPVNNSFIYPLQTISHPSCKFQDFDTLSGDCLIQLPRIQQANYDAYVDDALVRGVYSVLWSSSYDEGWDRVGGHSGTDFRTSLGTPALSIGDGVVVKAGFNKGYGNVVQIKYLTSSGDIIYAVYAHLDSIAVAVDQKVTKGQTIGTVGNTGNSHGVHLHYEIDTTTRWGRPLYPYMNCEEKDPYLQNHTDICRDELEKHSDDPIVFHEKYFSTLVATVDNAPQPKPEPVAEPTPQPEPTPEPEPIQQEPSHPAPDEPKEIVVDVDAVKIDANDTTLQPIYDIITTHVPALDVSSLHQEGQDFFDTYGIEITHKMSPKISVGGAENIELYIYDKKNSTPYSGNLPVDMQVVTTSGNVGVSPATITRVHNGRVVVRLQGAKSGTAVAGLTVDDTIFYAVPVLVE